MPDPDADDDARSSSTAAERESLAGPGPAVETTPADTDAAGAARDRSAAAEKVKGFPTTPGVYLMKDAAGRVIYVGKAKNLRARAGSYFLKAAAEDRRTAASFIR